MCDSEPQTSFKMKTALYLTLILTSLVGCKKAPEPTVQAEPAKWTAPAQGPIDVYINQFTLSPTNGATFRPSFTSPTNSHASGSTNQEGKPPYSADITYLGTKDGVDHYSFITTYPVAGGMKSETKEIYYSGTEIEIFRDSEYRIGIRPSTEKNR